ncbi:MAG: hypothetical protein Q9210_002059, partial [Variospora velana]
GTMARQDDPAVPRYWVSLMNTRHPDDVDTWEHKSSKMDKDAFRVVKLSSVRPFARCQSLVHSLEKQTIVRLLELIYGDSKPCNQGFGDPRKPP